MLVEQHSARDLADHVAVAAHRKAAPSGPIESLDGQAVRRLLNLQPIADRFGAARRVLYSLPA